MYPNEIYFQPSLCSQASVLLYLGFFLGFFQRHFLKGDFPKVRLGPLMRRRLQRGRALRLGGGCVAA